MIDAAGNVKITGLDKKGDIKSRLASLIAPELLKMIHKRQESETSVKANKQSDYYQVGSLISTMLYGRAESLKMKKREEEGDSIESSQVVTQEDEKL